MISFEAAPGSPGAYGQPSPRYRVLRNGRCVAVLLRTWHTDERWLVMDRSPHRLGQRTVKGLAAAKRWARRLYGER